MSGFGFGFRASGSRFTRWGLHQGFRDQASELIICIKHGEKCLGFWVSGLGFWAVVKGRG